MSGPLLFACLVLGAGMVYALYALRSRGAPWGKPAAGLAAALLVLLVIVNAVCRGSGPDVATAIARAKAVGDQYAYAAGYVLGKHLAQACRGRRAVIVTAFNDRRSKPGVEGLKEGAGGAIEFVDEVVVGEGLRTTEAGLPYLTLGKLFRPEDMESILQRKFDLLISFAGIPVVFERARGAPTPGRVFEEAPVQWVLASPDHGACGLSKNLVENGKVVAVVAHNLKALRDPQVYSDAPSGVQATFDARYVLVHPGNLQDVVAKHPDVFAR